MSPTMVLYMIYSSYWEATLSSQVASKRGFKLLLYKYLDPSVRTMDFESKYKKLNLIGLNIKNFIRDLYM
jgi:hypothetical protein